tara:strand:- start:578 stop:904 length:327 start_codon:yes stop_codon:yes gene_type:complete
MAKTSLQLWHQLQNANASNSTGYMNEFVTSQNPLRSGGHVFTDSNVAIRNLKLTRMASDSGGGDVISLESFRDGLLSGRAAYQADLEKLAEAQPNNQQVQDYAYGGRQ